MGPAPHTPPIPESWAARPTSPTPTAGLGAGFGMDPAAAGRPERLRQAWGSIRERLGLRPTPQSTTASSVAHSSEAPSGLASNDPRELVLAQMARAFNLGFGLGDTSSAAAHREGEHSEEPHRADGGTGTPSLPSEGSSQLPPDGSFERFLIDLQTDLRAALMNSNTLSDPAGNTEQSIAQPSGEEATSADQALPTPDDADGNASDSESEYQDAHETEADNDHAPISSASDPTSSPESQEHPSPTQNIDISSVPTDPDNGSTGRPIEGQDTDAQGRINWWRLYRFPPITTTRTPNASGTPTTPLTSRIPAGSNPTSLTPDSPTSADIVDPTLSELPFANLDVDSEEDRTHTVVPVIVVGLQSVTANWQQPHMEDTDHADPFMGNEEEVGEEGDASLNSNNTNRAEASDGTRRATASRGRAWHSRAADALRNLRPGRRNRTTPAPAAPGSRTFLIYVIGGQSQYSTFFRRN